MTVWQRAAFFFHLYVPRESILILLWTFGKNHEKTRRQRVVCWSSLMMQMGLTIYRELGEQWGRNYIAHQGSHWSTIPEMSRKKRQELLSMPECDELWKKKLLSNRGPSSKSAKSSVLRRNIAAIVHFFKVVCVCSTTNEIRRLSPEDMNPRAKTTRCQLQTVFIVAAFHFHLITKEELVLCLRGHWQCIVFRFFWSHFFHPPMRCS